jgi:hypothetical protein
MADFVAKLGVQNRTQKPRIIWVEPWGEDFTLLPGEELLVVGRHESEQPWYFVIEWDESSQVYLEAANDFEVVQNGIRLECGHKRQAALEAGLKL